MKLRPNRLRWVAVGLLLIVSWLGVALHHHPDADSERPCLVCVVGQTPAVVTPAAAPGLVDDAVPTSIALGTEAIPCRTPDGASRERAPPA